MRCCSASSSQLRSILRSADFVARLGGDEFAFLFSGDADLAQQKAVRVAERILERLRIKVPTPNGAIQVGCTVGVAMYPAEADDSEALIALADRLMYIGKKSGRNRLVTAKEMTPQQPSARPCHLDSQDCLALATGGAAVPASARREHPCGLDDLVDLILPQQVDRNAAVKLRRGACQPQPGKPRVG